MSRYIKAFKHKNEKKNKNKLTSFRINDNKLLEKYENIWTKIENLKNIKLGVLPGFDDRYIKTKIRTYGDNIYTNFCGLNVPENGKGCESFTLISIGSLLACNGEYYLQIYSDNCVFKAANTKMIEDYLDGNLFEFVENLFFDNWIKSNNSKEFIVCHYWLVNHKFNFHGTTCNGGHDFKMLS